MPKYLRVSRFASARARTKPERRQARQQSSRRQRRWRDDDGDDDGSGPRGNGDQKKLDCISRSMDRKCCVLRMAYTDGMACDGMRVLCFRGMALCASIYMDNNIVGYMSMYAGVCEAHSVRERDVGEFQISTNHAARHVAFVLCVWCAVYRVYGPARVCVYAQ